MDSQLMELNIIKREIENIRGELNILVSKKIENILDPEVIKLSQELDKLLLLYLNKDNNFTF
jgi:hypothetical protein